jgi:hypothetical protein
MSTAYFADGTKANSNDEDGPFGWWDFDAEPDVTGDGSGDPDKFFITITAHGEEFASIVHRTCGDKYPLNGELAKQKRENAEFIVAALNDYYHRLGG